MHSTHTIFSHECEKWGVEEGRRGKKECNTSTSNTIHSFFFASSCLKTCIMLIFMLNSQLLSVSGDSKTLTRRRWKEGWWDKALNIFGLWFFVMPEIDGGKTEKHKEIRMQMQSHLFIYSEYRSYMHTQPSIDQFNLIFSFYFSFRLLCTPIGDDF